MLRVPRPAVGRCQAPRRLPHGTQPVMGPQTVWRKYSGKPSRIRRLPEATRHCVPRRSTPRCAPTANKSVLKAASKAADLRTCCIWSRRGGSLWVTCLKVLPSLSPWHQGSWRMPSPRTFLLPSPPLHVVQYPSTWRRSKRSPLVICSSPGSAKRCEAGVTLLHPLITAIPGTGLVLKGGRTEGRD